MKIIIDARLYGLENAGLGRYVMNLLAGLMAWDKNNHYLILLRKKYFTELNCPDNWKKILTDFKHYSLIEQVRLPGLIKSHKPDIVHFPHFNIPIFYPGKFVVTVHDLLMQRYRGAKATTLPVYLYFPKQLAARYVFRQAVLKSEKIIVPSLAVKAEIKKYYPVKEEKVAVTYEGFDIKFLEAKEDVGILRKYNLHNPYFIYAGNAYPHKNLTRAIEAINLLNRDRAEETLLVIASPRSVFSKKLENLVNELGASQQVKLIGFVPDHDLASLYKNSLGFLFPSLSEGFGLPGIEAMAGGTLVLASDIPVFKEIYKNQAIYFNPYDFTSIEKSMEVALTMDTQKRREMIERNKEFVKKYSWSKMAEETLKVYEDCAGL
jgi:glycosyltransferase involved in cell wall biosynthesis